MKIVIDGKEAEVGGGSGRTSEEVYSTEETRIGTWIDGKPLYRRTITKSGLTPTGSDITIEVLPSTIYVVGMTGIYKCTKAEGIILGTSYSGTSSYNISVLVGATNNIILRGSGSTLANGSVFLQLLYTKTTDEATIQTTATAMQPAVSSIADEVKTGFVNTTATTASFSRNEEV